ncbi:glycosyltransferase family 4 protein [Tardiphaga robiniae]|uniref:Glycosyltransferase family 4 protein n=1 Tax=Tardiphaga robiniae TaxID=943830 RepID=A0A7G6TUK1_9BRAD|nr:glycosyltransferase family 4 protein [Tardiphaga robiniae]QND70433.1 glycosyltransferase family 4 protein [Tardiphaga robiniae]
MRLTIVQYAGDFREAYYRLNSGGKQTYQAQRYSVELVGRLAKSIEQMTVLCAITDEPYDEILPNGVRVIGAGFRQGFRLDLMTGLLERAAPTHLWISTPLLPVIRWALRKNIPAVAVLADSFNTTGIKEWIKKKRLATLLNRPGIRWVANHGLSACISLQTTGVNPSKIIPWDWPASANPADFAIRDFALTGSATVLYVGSISEAKGVGDLLKAADRLRRAGVDARFRIIGPDADGAMLRQSQALNLVETVAFAGPVPNENIIDEMRAADIVVVPSRHEYPEGMPLTIYEALCARTPIVASDHPMFRRVLVDGKTARIFKAGDPASLSHAVQSLLGDPSLYRILSANSLGAWQRLQVPVNWGALLNAWIAQDSSNGWLFRHRLNSGIYDL